MLWIALPTGATFGLVLRGERVVRRPPIGREKRRDWDCLGKTVDEVTAYYRKHYGERATILRLSGSHWCEVPS